MSETFLYLQQKFDRHDNYEISGPLSCASSFQNRLNELGNVFWKVFSAKQTARTASRIDSIFEVVPHAKRHLAELGWRISFLSKKIFSIFQEESFNRDVDALAILDRVENAATAKLNTLVVITEPECKAVSEFLSKVIATPECLDRLGFYLTYKNHTSLSKVFKTCRDLARVHTECTVESIAEKHVQIQAFLDGNVKEISEKYRISPKDYRFLFFSSSRKDLLETLRRMNIRFVGDDVLLLKWRALNEANKGSAMTKLREMASRPYLSKKIILPTRFQAHEIRDHQFDTIGMIKHIVQTPTSHMAILVPTEKGVQISHVTSDAGSHIIKPVVDPLFFAFFPLVDFDITPLIPSNVTQEDQKLLKEAFEEAFERIAMEERKDIPSLMSERPWMTNFLLGHKGFSKQSLSEVELKSNHALRCSGYVARVFLKAIQQVNLQLQKLGYKEQIDHPFGEHEILDRMDPLRLVYHWKNLKILKPIPFPKEITQILTSY